MLLRSALPSDSSFVRFFEELYDPTLVNDPTSSEILVANGAALALLDGAVDRWVGWCGGPRGWMVRWTAGLDGAVDRGADAGALELPGEHGRTTAAAGMAGEGPGGHRQKTGRVHLARFSLGPMTGRSLRPGLG